MRTTYHALPSLIFLLFAFFSTQHQTLADSEQVLDIYGDPLVRGKLYHILDADNHAHGIQAEEVGDQTCPISVIFGADAKKVIFTPKVEEEATSIMTEQDLYIDFSEVSVCAESANWTVAAGGNKVYPVLIGPPDGVKSLEGAFHIKKSGVQSNTYNLAFTLFENDEYFLVTQAYRPNQDIYRLELCTDTGYDVVFYPIRPPTLTSTYVPHRIRKIVA